MNTEPANQMKDHSPTDEALAELAESVATLEDILGCLSNRLEPVLTEPHPTSPDEMGKTENPHCYVVSRIRSQAELIRSMSRRTDDLIGRLEI